MRVHPSSRSALAPAVTRVQRSRPYADYRLLDEHDPLVHSGADEQRRRAAAVDAAHSVAALMRQIAALKGALERGSMLFRRYEPSESAADCIGAYTVETLLYKLNNCLHVFDEHAALRKSWRQSLIDPFLLPQLQQCGIELIGNSFANLYSDEHSSRNDRLIGNSPRTPAVVKALFGRHGAAAALRPVIERIERSPASVLLDAEVLTLLHGSAGAVYSPFMRMHSLKRVSLLLNAKG